jgi:hypothetical protein
MSIFGPCTVLIGDPANPDKIEEWCREQEHFEGVVATDVSDVSMNYDVVYTYMFSNEEAANWFRLRWL